MPTLPDLVVTLWGRRRAPQVVGEYRQALTGRALLLRDLAMFCNAAAPIQGGAEFDRGVEEGKRRVWLHITRMCGLEPADFVAIADGQSRLATPLPPEI
jgi:hypothetical protein